MADTNLTRTLHTTTAQDDQSPVPTGPGGGGKPVQITRARRWVRGPRLCSVSFSLSRYHLSTEQINFIGPSTGHSATESRTFRFNVQIFSLFTLSGGPENFPPPRGPNPLSAAMPIDGGNFRGKNFLICPSYFWHRILCRSVPASRRSKRAPSSFNVAKTSNLWKMCHEFKR